MATTNFSGSEFERQTIVFFQRSSCLQDFKISLLNSFLSITAYFGNALVLVALRKETSLHPPSKVLLRNLATTDLCVGVISQPFYAALLLTVVNEHWNVCRYVEVVVVITSAILCLVSLLTLTAISVDRLLALLLGLRYRQVVTLRRAYGTVIVFWAVSTVYSISRLFLDSYTRAWCDASFISLCLVTSTYSYTRIFINLHRRQNQVQDQVQQPNQTNQLNIGRYRKAVFTALLLQLTLVACYLPYVISANLFIHAKLSSPVFIAWNYTLTLLFLNSTLNPILYCGEGHNQKSTLLLMELSLVELYSPLAYQAKRKRKNHSKQ